jgi:hypothetical protein
MAMGCTGTYKVYVTNSSDSKVEINYRLKKGYTNKSKPSIHKTSIKAGKTKRIGKILLRYNEYGFIATIDSAAFISKTDTAIYSKSNPIEKKIYSTGHGIHTKYRMDFGK